MKVSSIIPLLSLGLSTLPIVSAQAPITPILNAAKERLSSITYLLEIGGKANNPPVVLEPGKIHQVDVVNWRDVLEHTDVDWLVLFTTGEVNCPGCGIYEKVFNDAIELLKDYPAIHFARIDCDAQALLCSIFGSWGARVYHVSHTDEVGSKIVMHKTHLHPVPFHRPGTEGAPIIDENGKEKKAPPPPPDAAWVAEAVREEKWRTFNEWDDWTQPFDGHHRELIFIWWWFVNLFSGIPPMAMMISIGLLSRYVTSRFTGRVLAPQPRQQQAAAAAAAGASKKTK